MSDRYILTTEEALSVLPDGDLIHTAIVNVMWIGADWGREAVIDHITKAGGAAIGGPMSMGSGHGLCLDIGRHLFCRHDPERMAALEAKIAAEPSD